MLSQHLHVTDSLIHLLLHPVSLHLSFSRLKWSSEVVNEKNIYKEYILRLATNKTIARGQESWGRKDASWSMLRPARYSSLTCQANNCKYRQLSLCLSWCISKLFKFVLPLREKICCRLKQPCRKLTSGCHMDLDFWPRYTERSSTLRLARDPNSGIHHPSSLEKVQCSIHS